jgi:FixJ family two-component response regulator
MINSHMLVAVVDDEDSVRKALSRLFRSAGFETRTFASAPEFFESLPSHVPDCLVLDLHLIGLTGLDVLNLLDAVSLRLPTVVITGHDMPGMRERALASGAAAYLLKPLDDKTLISAVLASIQNTTVDRKN